MRALIITVLFSLATIASVFADPSVAGHWKSVLGNDVTIDMHIASDGRWSSETSQGREVVRRMAGTYTQTPSGSRAGEMVFTPTTASASDEKAEVETDSFKLSENGQELRLTSGGDTMVFQKQSP